MDFFCLTREEQNCKINLQYKSLSSEKNKQNNVQGSSECIGGAFCTVNIISYFYNDIAADLIQGDERL